MVCQQCRHFVSFEQSSAKRGIGGSKKRENAGSYGQDHGRSKRFLGVSVRKFEWTAIPTSLGLACIAVVGFRHSWKRHQRDQNRAAEAAHVYNGIEVEDWRVRVLLYTGVCFPKTLSDTSKGTLGLKGVCNSEIS